MQKCFVDAPGQRRIAKLLLSDRKATVTQTTHHSIAEHTTCETLKQMSYRATLYRGPLLSAKTRKLQLQFIFPVQNWTKKR